MVLRIFFSGFDVALVGAAGMGEVNERGLLFRRRGEGRRRVMGGCGISFFFGVDFFYIYIFLGGREGVVGDVRKWRRTKYGNTA